MADFLCRYRGCEAETPRDRAVVVVDHKATDPHLKTRVYCTKLHAALAIMVHMADYGNNSKIENEAIAAAVLELKRLCLIRGVSI